ETIHDTVIRANDQPAARNARAGLHGLTGLIRPDLLPAGGIDRINLSVVAAEDDRVSGHDRGAVDPPAGAERPLLRAVRAQQAVEPLAAVAGKDVAVLRDGGR